MRLVAVVEPDVGDEPVVVDAGEVDRDVVEATSVGPVATHVDEQRDVVVADEVSSRAMCSPATVTSRLATMNAAMACSPR